VIARVPALVLAGATIHCPPARLAGASSLDLLSLMTMMKINTKNVAVKSWMLN
jgi:hypothetical protein